MKTKKFENKKPKLKVVFDKKDDAIYHFLSEKYELDILDFESLTEYPDLAIFTGGSDVNPDLYSEVMGKYTQVDKKRDIKAQEIYRTLESRTKFLGICRGSQFLTVMSGGSLIQHVEGHTKSHNIVLGETEQIIEVTSTHHQMLYPYILDDKQFNLLGWSEKFQSTTYLNGKNQEWNLTKKFLEPEIVFYKNTNSLAIQGHPEFKGAKQEFKDVTLDLIERLINDNLSEMEYTNPYNHIGGSEEKLIIESVPRDIIINGERQGDMETPRMRIDRQMRRVLNDIRFMQQRLEREGNSIDDRIYYTTQLNRYRIRQAELTTELNTILEEEPEQNLEL